MTVSIEAPHANRNVEFDQYLVKNDIEHRLTVPHTPQQNGVAERFNRILQDIARCLMIQSSKGGIRLDTDQLDTTNHSDRCLEAFHCSSAVSGSCSIDSCPNGGHSSSNNEFLDAIATACYIRNRCPTSTLNGNIPFEKWTGKSLNYDNLKIFGSKIFFLDKVFVLDKDPTKES